MVYFASNDSHAYAVDAETGKQVWKSEKLPGEGFHSWWPVVCGDYVLLPGSENYPNGTRFAPEGQFLQFPRSELFPDGDNRRDMGQYRGMTIAAEVTERPAWARGNTVLDFSKSNQGTLPVTEYFEQKPWRRTLFVLDRATGKEVTYDFDNDGQPEYAPLMHQGTHTDYPPYEVAHIGWDQGAQREVFDTPPETAARLAKSSRQNNSSPDFSGWPFPPQANYLLWKYAQAFGGARELAGKLRPMPRLPSDDALAQRPYVLNAYLAGLIGAVELGKLAGQPPPPAVQQQLSRLLALRTARFSKDRPPVGRSPGERYQIALGVSRNFMYLTPEVAQCLREHALPQVREALAEYERVAPFWFVSRAEETYGEAVIGHLWDRHSLFQAKALILKEPYEALTRYVDVPAFAVGDLHYIDNLVSALEAVRAAAPISRGTSHEE